MYASETSKHRDKLIKFCTGDGCDIGFGGDPITDAAVRIDFATPYASTGKAPVQLGGDCRNLKWFRNDALDYVYSSHVLEDFPETETINVMLEWVRVLKPGGKLILLLPDQQRYLTHCRREDQPINPHHAIDHFSAKYICDVASQMPELSLVTCNDDLGDYSFFVVFEKTASTHGDAAAQLASSLDKALAQLNGQKLELEHCQARLNYIHNQPIIRVLVAAGRLVKKVAGKNKRG